MVNFKIEEYQVGMIGTNCYFLINEDSKEMIVVDPGGNAPMLAQKIRAAGYQPKAVLLTHGHFDHAMGAEELAKEFGISIYVHEADQKTLEDPSYNVSGMTGRQMVFHADKSFTEKDVLELAGFQIEVLHTPGHTPGGACFYLKEEKVLFSGDSLFNGSIGRTDFPGGSASQLVRAVKDKLMCLPDEVKVYPGHDMPTTIVAERMYNPFL